MDVSDIKDRDSFQAWLEDKPKEWAQVLAARVALRVAPIAWSVVALSEDVLEKKHRGNLILFTFRANFISSLARKYPADDMKRAASAAFAAGVFNAAVDVVDAVDAATYAAYAVDAAAYAVDAAAYAVDAAAYAAMSDAAFGTAADAGNAAINSFWACIRADRDWLEDLAEGNYDYSVTQAQALSNEPLWIKSAAPDTLPMALKKKFHEFNESELAQTTSFGLITDWYRSILEGKPSPFSKEAELAIAKMSPEDWGDGDDERDCVAVMDRVAELAGWSRDMTRADDLYLDDDVQEAANITVPPQEAAPLEVEIKNGKIERLVSTATTNVSDLEQVHRILRAETEYFIERIGGQSPDARSSLENLLIELHDTHPNTVILAVGYWHGVLSGMIVRIDEQILGDAAGRFAGLINNLDLFLKQHDEWNNYIRAAQSSEVSNASHDLLTNPVQQVMDELAQNEQVVDQEVFSVLRSLKVGLGDGLSYNPETAYGFYRSLANVTQSLVELAISEGADALSNYARDVGGELRKRSVGALATAILVTLGYQFVSLTTNLPSMFGFLNPVLKALRII